MIRVVERLNILLLVLLVLTVAEASVLHHHGEAASGQTACVLDSNAARPGDPPFSLRATHVCALCVAAVQGAEFLPCSRWIPISPIARPLADPPLVDDLANIHSTLSRRGPPAA